MGIWNYSVWSRLWISSYFGHFVTSSRMTSSMSLNVCETNSKLFGDLAKELQKDQGYVKLKGLAEELCGMSLDLDKQSSRLEAETLLLLLGDFGCDMATLVYLLEKLELWSALALIKQESLALVQDIHMNQLWVRLGGRLCLSCRAVGYPPPKYQWLRDEVAVSGEIKDTFVVELVRPEHAGTFVCSVSQNGTDQSAIRTRTVTVNIVPEKPKVGTQPQLKIDGNRRFLILEARAFPSPWFWWYRNAVPLEEKRESPVFEVPFEGPGSGGTFSCLIGNEEGTVWSDEIVVESSLDDDCIEAPLARDKVAILIGNSLYKSHPLLLSAFHDVVTLACDLEALSFRVVPLINLTLVEMKNALERVAENTPEGSYVVVYYGGHGFSFYGNDYLIPVDAPPNGAYKCSDALDKEEIVAVFSSVKPSLLAIFLDMCRKTPTEEENPFLHSERPKIHRYEPQRNLIYGFATTMNLSAFELSNEKNGIFMKYLQKHIKRRIPVRQLLAEVQADILREPSAAARLQMPSVTSNLAKDISLADSVGRDLMESNAGEFWREINQLPPDQVFHLKHGAKLHVQFKKKEAYLLNAVEMLISCEKLKGGLQLTCNAEDVVLTTEITETGESACACQVLVEGIQKLKKPADIVIFMPGQSSGELVPVATIDLGLPLIACLQLSVNKL